jgi:hypothetical protein
MPSRTAGPSLHNHGRLVLLAVLLPTIEVAILIVTRLDATLPLATQVSAPAPFGAFHDLRWLLVYHQSWLGFATEAIAAIVFRATIAAAMVRAAWPIDDECKPPFRQAFRHQLAFTVAAYILLLPSAALLFALAVAPVSWLFFAGLPAAVAIALVIHHGAVTPRWWCRSPSLRSVGWIALTFLILTLDGAALVAAPRVLWIPIAAAGGLFNAWAWLGFVRSLVRKPPLTTRPVALVGFAALAGGAICGVVIGMAGHGQTSRFRDVAHNLRPSGRPVLVLTGFNSQWDGSPSSNMMPGFDTHRFSYRGVDAGDQPLPYDNVDTHRSLGALVAEMTGQVDILHRATGQSIDVVAESEGSVVAQAYAATAEHPPVHRMVLLSPIVEPGRVRFPKPSVQGWGLGSGWALRGVAMAVRGVSATDLAPDSAFMHSLMVDGPALRDLLGCRPDGIDELVLFPLADAVSGPGAHAVALNDSVIPAFHGGLLGEQTAQQAVALGLHDGRLPSLAIWTAADRFISAASAGWQAPALSTVIGWSGDNSLDCNAARARLRHLDDQSVAATGGSSDNASQ